LSINDVGLHLPVRQAVLALLIALLAPASALAAVPTLAVTYFDNNTSEARFDPLGRGLADMLITDLAGLEGLTVVERGRLNDIMGELELQASSFVDPKTAVKVGKGLGAEYVLTGAFLAIEPDMRIDARIINVSTGKVVQAQAVTGPVDEFFLLEKELATEIISELDVTVSARESARMGRPATENFDAFVAYSAGLEALDRGELEQARTQLADALEHDDRFALATDHLDRLQDRLRQLKSRGREIRSEVARRFLARLDELEAAGGPWEPLEQELLEVSTRVMPPAGAADLLTVSSRVIDLQLPEQLKLGGPQGMITVNDWALYSYVAATYNLGMRAELLTYGEAYLERYPASMYSPAVQSYVTQVMQLVRSEEAGRSKIPTVQAESKAYADQQTCYQVQVPDVRLEACRSWVSVLEAAGLPLDDNAEEAWARAAHHAGQIEEIERILARVEARDRYAESVEDIRSILNRARGDAEDADELLAKLPTSEREGEWSRAAGELVSAGRHAEAREVLEDGLKRFPAANQLHRVAVRSADSIDDVEYATAALTRWEAAESQGAEVEPSAARTVREMQERIRKASQRQGWELFKLATGYQQIDQYNLAGDAFMKLADEQPDFEWTRGDNALNMAASAYRMALDMTACREAYETLLERYPDSDVAASANSMLEWLP
jgi:TolB-like protein